jgi:polysaccharide biosynthesis/export protein
MTLAHYHLRPCTGVVRHGRVWMSLFVALIFATTLCARPAWGQFSGPALGASTQVNPPVVITTDPAILYPGHRDAYLGIGDVLTIHLYGSSDYAPTAHVDVDGKILLPLIGAVEVDGLTVRRAQDLIAERLISAGMYREPQVSIQIVESPNQIVTIIGEVHAIVPVVGERRLYDVLASAGAGGGGGAGATTVVVGSGIGGLPSTASHVITINRPGVPEPITVDLGTDPSKSAVGNIPIFARDTIIVPRVGVVYLLGAFRTQGAIPLTQNSPLTLMKVAALGGGPGFEGRYNDLRIVRSVGLERQVVRVDIKKVLDGKAPDPVLQPEDIVFLPSSSVKAAIKNGGVGTLLGVVSLLIAIKQ